MSKRIYFNAFHMNCVVHQSPGLWVRPDDKMLGYTKLVNWVELAKLLEKGKAYAITPGTLADFIDGVVPVLQRRGLMQKEYQEGTLREKLYGHGRARLRDDHPAATYRIQESRPIKTSPIALARALGR
jgi:hypothetical protein